MSDSEGSYDEVEEEVLSDEESVSEDEAGSPAAKPSGGADTDALQDKIDEQEERIVKMEDDLKAKDKKISSLEDALAALTAKVEKLAVSGVSAGGSKKKAAAAAASDSEEEATPKKKTPKKDKDKKKKKKKATLGKKAGKKAKKSKDDGDEADASGGIRYWPLRGFTYPPSDFDKDDHSTKEPEASLKLHFVFGYRGYDCRQNAFYTADDKIVFFTAAVGIVYDPEEHTQVFFKGHDDDITAMAIAPDRKTVATGQVGKVPYVCVWDTTTLKQKAKLTNYHERGICAIGFNASGKLLASVGNDNSHCIAVWEWEKKPKKPMVQDKGHTDKIFLLKYNEAGTALTCGVKHIKFWTIKEGLLSSKRGVFGKLGKVQSILSITFDMAGATISGAQDGDIYFWKGTEVSKSIKKAHKGGVGALCATEDGLASGGKDGFVRVWDLKSHKKIAEFEIGSSVRSLDWHDGHILVGTSHNEIFEIEWEDKECEQLLEGHFAELWGLGMHPSANVFATAAEDKTVRVWDVAERKLLRKAKLGKGAHSVAWNPDATLLAVGLCDGGFVVLDAETLEVKHEKKDCIEVIDEIKFSPDGTMLEVGSHDNFIDVYSVKKDFKRLARCKGHSSYVTHCDWSADSKIIQSNCGAYEILYWDATEGDKVRAAGQRDQDWASFTCVLGWSVSGIWPEGSDGTDVNALDVNKTKDLCATADDFGMVKLFRYPVYKPRQKNVAHGGHSSHVTCVRWSFDDSVVVTTGGQDQSIFLWNVDK